MTSKASVRPLAALALLVLALAGCGGSDGAADEAPETTAAATTTAATASGDAGLFAFDRDSPLDVTEGETAQQPEFTAKAMSYASPGGDRVPGIVLLPKAKATASRAGVIFMHGAGGSRVDFLGDASELAKEGAVTLTIDSPFARSESEQIRAGSVAPDTAHDLMVQNVKDLLRGLDVLVEEYDVDPERLAVVGYSMGVQQAATAAALDDRVRAVVLIAGRANPSRTPGDAGWARQFRSIDTVHFAPELAPASVLVQGGERDTIVPRAELEELYGAASEPKELRWYDSGHEMSPKAGRERVAWLIEELGLD